MKTLSAEQIKQIQENLEILITCCDEGFDGTWNSVGEGADGFIAMRDLLDDIAKVIK